MTDFVGDEGGDLLELRRRRVRRLDDQTSFATSYLKYIIELLLLRLLYLSCYLKDVIVFIYCILFQLLHLLYLSCYLKYVIAVIAFIAFVHCIYGVYSLYFI